MSNLHSLLIIFCSPCTYLYNRDYGDDCNWCYRIYFFYAVTKITVGCKTWGPGLWTGLDRRPLPDQCGSHD